MERPIVYNVNTQILNIYPETYNIQFIKAGSTKDEKTLKKKLCE